MALLRPRDPRIIRRSCPVLEVTKAIVVRWVDREDHSLVAESGRNIRNATNCGEDHGAYFEQKNHIGWGLRSL